MATMHRFDVVYKGWLKKASKDEAKKKGFLRSSTKWKKKYCALCKVTENGVDITYLCIFDKEINVTEMSKEFLKLWPHYRVSKKHDPSGKNHAFTVKTPEDVVRFMADSLTMMDLWVFHIQIQTKMHPDFMGETFEVSPVESDSVRRIGARGSKCLIHLSKWGLTLALKRTRSVVAQWPLKCIREFESSETGMFSFDAGRNSPMGEAHYAFNTSPGQDGEMYDILDGYTTEIMASRQPSGPVGSQSYQEVTEEEVVKDYESLRLATFGLLPVKPRANLGQLPAVPPPPASTRSSAVPVPGRPEYNHLKRHPSEIGPVMPAEKVEPVAVKPPASPLRRNKSQPQMSPRAPPIPLSTHPVLAGKMQRSSSTDNLDIPSSMQGYADMSPANTLERTTGPTNLGAAAAAVALPPRIPLFKHPPTAGSMSRSLMSKSPYYNILQGSYENCPLISPSPGDRFAFTNEGFVNSLGSSVMSPPGSRGRSAHSTGLYSPTPITHTYYEHNLSPPTKSQSLIPELHSSSSRLDSAMLYAKVNKKFRKSLSADNLEDLKEIQEKRASVVSQVSIPERMSGISINSGRVSVASHRTSGVSMFSLENSSPLIGSLDLAGMPRQAPEWLGLRDLPSVPNESPVDLNLYCRTPGSSLSSRNGFAMAAALVSQASSGSTQYEDIEKMKMMYEEMNRRKSAIPPPSIGEGYAVRDAIIVRPGSSQSRPSPTRARDIPTRSPVSPVSNRSSYERDIVIGLSFEHKSPLSRAQSTGDLLEAASSLEKDLGALNLRNPTSVRRFKSIPSMVIGDDIASTIGMDLRSNSSNDLSRGKQGSPSKGQAKPSPVTWTMRKLKQHNAARKKERERTETSPKKESTKVKGQGGAVGDERKSKEQKIKEKSKQKVNKVRSRSKDREKGFSGRDVKIVASGTTKTFTKQATSSSSISLDTISVNSQMSGRQLPARPLQNLTNVKEGTYEDIEEEERHLRRASEAHSNRQVRNPSHEHRRNTAPSNSPHGS